MYGDCPRPRRRFALRDRHNLADILVPPFPAIRLLPRPNGQLLNRVRSESQFFLFAAETVSNTIRCEAYMARGIAMITGTCRQPGDGAGSSAYTVTRAKLTGNS